MRILIFTLLFTFLLLQVGVKSQILSKSPNILGYQQTTSGLLSPQFEGGRTDFCLFDINQDGHSDILTIGDHGSPGINADEHGIIVWFGDGNGGFTNYMSGDFGYGGIAAGDMNLDGLMDVGYGLHHDYSSTDLGNQLIEVALGDGTGMNWTAWDDGLATNGEDWGMFGTTFGDFDNDGDLDLASISFGSGGGIHVYLNNLDGTWTQSFGFLGGNSDMLIESADLNNDGFLDFVSAHQNGTAWFGNGSGNFVLNNSGLPPIGSFAHSGISTGDVNNDGAKDLSFVNTSGGLEVWSFDRVFQIWYELSGNLPTSGDFEMSQLADMNMDGFLDIAGFGSGELAVWLGDGSGNWIQGAQISVGNPGSAQAFRAGGDFDHNGFPDVVFLAEIGNWPSYQNKLFCFLESSPADSLFIQPIYPKGNENFYPGSVQVIKWSSEYPENSISSVNIEISAFGPDGPWWNVVSGIPNNGSYQWIVPETGSQNCFLKLTVNNGFNSATSQTLLPFTIFGEPTSSEKSPASIELLFPNPGIDQVQLLTPNIKLVGFLNSMGEEMLVIGNPSKIINVSQLKSGIYIVEIRKYDDTESIQKWVKQ